MTLPALTHAVSEPAFLRGALSSRIATVTLFAVLPLGSTIGCGSTDPAQADDHHQEHHVPEHKPPNFAAAVEELEHRFLGTADHDSDHARSADDAREELQDIVGWLPELAADSDLGEADWKTARNVGRQLADLLTAVGDQPLSQSAQTEARQLIESLTALVPRAGTPEPAIHHDHDHHHGHHHDHDHHDDHGHHDARGHDHHDGHHPEDDKEHDDGHEDEPERGHGSHVENENETESRTGAECGYGPEHEHERKRRHGGERGGDDGGVSGAGDRLGRSQGGADA